MKKTALIALFTVVALSMTAQDKLIRIDTEEIAWQKKNRQYLFFDKEKARLLMPHDAAFGVECIPSFSPEWSLTYDSIAHSLVYHEAQKSIWYSTYDAMYKKKTKIDRKRERKIIKRKLRKSPKDYQAPDVKTYTLTISADQVQMLKAIWSSAIGTAEWKLEGTLDGTTWIYFIGEKQARAHTPNVPSIVKFTEQLVEAIKIGDASNKDRLIENEFQRAVSNLTIESAP